MINRIANYRPTPPLDLEAENRELRTRLRQSIDRERALCTQMEIVSLETTRALANLNAEKRALEDQVAELRRLAHCRCGCCCP